ncbi:MAG: S41 family peptidase, partial [Planctomycetia bacterium]
PTTVSVERDVIEIESVIGDAHKDDDSWEFFVDKESKIGYVRINSFIQNTASDLAAVLKPMQEQGLKALILDLRYNPGGLLPAAIDVADLFIEEGAIVSTQGRNTVPKTYSAEKDGTLANFPLVVLVNRFSASASEIVAACLQDHKRAVVIGERSWGKGSVQNVIELEGGRSALKLTTASYQRPNGKNIHRFKDSKDEDEWGVKPNDGFDVLFTQLEHNAYMRQRQEKDKALGKLSERKKAAADAKSAEAKAAEKKEAEKKDESKKEANGKPEEKKSDAKNNDDGKPFVDKQLLKALDYLKGEIAKTAKPAG